MRIVFLCLSFVLLSMISFESNFQLVGLIHANVRDASGICGNGDDLLFVIGDSGNESVIYVVNNEGEGVKEILLSNTINEDWEEVQIDSEGTLYVADTGNNLNYRTNLRIYKVPHFIDRLDEDSIANAELISLTYEDQVDNPEPVLAANFNIEAFIPYGDVLHLFSKDQQGTGYTKRYELITEAGVQVATLIDSVAINKWITGAHYDEFNDELFLLSDDQIFSFTNYSTSGFSISNKSEEFNTLQLEGVFKNQHDEFFMVEDIEAAEMKSNMYRMLKTYSTDFEIELAPNPCLNYIDISSQTSFSKIQIKDIQGTPIVEFVFPSGSQGTRIDLQDYPAGVYLIQCWLEEEVKTKRFVKN